MKNKKGFVMTETLVVTVFLVTIFTFIYISIIPLIGTYEDKIEREGDIDILYKLYHIRKMLYNDPNKDLIINSSVSGINYKVLVCSSFSDQSYCNDLMNFLELTSNDGSNIKNNYLLVYVNDIYDNWTTGVKDKVYNDIINNYSTEYKLDTQYNVDVLEQVMNDFDTYLKNNQKEEGRMLVLLDLERHTICHLLVN